MYKGYTFFVFSDGSCSIWHESIENEDMEDNSTMMEFSTVYGAKRWVDLNLERVEKEYIALGKYTITEYVNSLEY